MVNSRLVAEPIPARASVGGVGLAFERDGAVVQKREVGETRSVVDKIGDNGCQN